MEVTEGVYIDSLLNNSAAAKSGLKSGDVILSIDGEKTGSSPKLQEIIASHRPGDKLKVIVDRDGKQKEYVVTLKNRAGSTDLVKKEDKELLSILGCQLKPIDSKTAKKLGIKGGVKVVKISEGKLRRYTQMREGFIITHANNQAVKSIDEFIKLIDNKEGGVMIAGVYEDVPGRYCYAFGL